MSERGLPSVDGAPACPFVAFEDDQDGRSLAPDHRHRCFAEPRPATRALAHQEAYCLSSAFPVCPTFQDWARRQAATARGVAAQPDASPSRAAEAPSGTPPPLDREAARASEAGSSAPPADRSAPPASAVPPTSPQGSVPEAPRRTTQRDWAAPPPWLAEAEDVAPDDGALYGGDPYDDLPPLDDAGYAGDDDRGMFPAPAAVEPPSFLAAKSAAPADPSHGLAGSAADRFAGADPYLPQPASPAQPPGAAVTGSDPDDWAGPGTAAVAAATARPSSSSGRRRYEAERAGPGRAPQAAPRTPVPAAGSRDPAGRGGQSRPQDAQELFGPAWEPARRYEAYPSLRTRIGLPRIGGIPPLGLAVIALVLAAAFLFFVGPMLLGVGSKDDGTGASPTPAATEEATAEPEPTLAPEPTPQVYVIKQGDTISKIARKFGVTTEELLAANPKIKNPDKIKVGQEITIPVPVTEEIVDTTVDDGTVEDSPAP